MTIKEVFGQTYLSGMDEFHTRQQATKFQMIGRKSFPTHKSRLPEMHGQGSPRALCEGLRREYHPIRYLLLLILCAVSFFTAYGQQQRMQFKHLTVDDGLSSSCVYSAVQDSKGYLWFGTSRGLSRYDGTTIVDYNDKIPKTEGIYEYPFYTLFKDHDNQLFIASIAGISRYDRDKDTFINLSSDTSSPLYGMEITAFNFDEDSDGNLWLAAGPAGIIYLDRKRDNYIQYQYDSMYAPFIFVDSRNRIWVTIGNGLTLFSPASGTFKEIVKTNQLNFTSGQIVEDLYGNIWFGSGNGLFRITMLPANDSIEVVHCGSNRNDPRSISHGRIKALFVDDPGNVWVGVENGGIEIYNHRTNSFNHYQADEFSPNCMNNKSVNSITQDRNKNIWVCTFNGGVFSSIKNSDFIIHYKNMPGVSGSLSYNIVSSFCEDPLGRLWVGTDGGGLNLFNDTTNRFIGYYNDNQARQPNVILCMVAQSHDHLLMGTWEKGLVRYSISTNTCESYPPQKNSIPGNVFWSMAKDSAENLWLGSFRDGLIYYGIKDNKVLTYTPQNSPVLQYEIKVVKIGADGNVYFGSQQGFQIFFPHENRFETFTAHCDDSTAISNNTIVDIVSQSDTCVWIGTLYGLNRFNPKSGKFKQLFKKDGLPDNCINGLTLDHNGALWITTNSGICRYDDRLGAYKTMTVSDGLQSNEFIQRAVLTTKTGDILAGGTNGFNMIHPDRYSENRSIPPIVITDLHLFNERVPIGLKGSPLQKQISETESMTLNYKQTNITFSFAAMDFTNPLKNQYAYTMDNFDKGWTYCGNRKDATYTNLDPGHYRFIVKGSNNDGLWNETGTTLAITITPPWWMTRTARIGFIAGMISLLSGIYYYRITRLNRQKRLLENLVKQRTIEIEEKNKILSKQTTVLSQQTHELTVSNEKLISLNATKDKLFSIIAHDLKNPFTSILGIHENLARRYDTMNDAKRKHMLEIVYASSAKIFRLLESLLDWARTQTGKITFNPEEFVLNELIDDTILFVENLAKEKKIEINQSLEHRVVVFADKNMLNTVIRNLITNAIKFTENGTIGIEANQDADATIVKITDSGVGIIPEKSASLFHFSNAKSSFGTRGESGTGLGLIICKEFIERHSGTIAVESEIGKGSTFYFTIPHKSSPTKRAHQQN
jgi:signal transduction histidine kinase/ligand-binding sensor domain-containing protein